MAQVRPGCNARFCGACGRWRCGGGSGRKGSCREWPSAWLAFQVLPPASMGRRRNRTRRPSTTSKALVCFNLLGSEGADSIADRSVHAPDAQAFRGSRGCPAAAQAGLCSRVGTGRGLGNQSGRIHTLRNRTGLPWSYRAGNVRWGRGPWALPTMAQAVGLGLRWPAPFGRERTCQNVGCAPNIPRRNLTLFSRFPAYEAG